MEYTSKMGNITTETSSGKEEIDYGEQVELKYGLYMMFSSVFFFQCLNWIVLYLGTPKRVTVNSWKWRNLFISWIHAFIVGPWVLLCLYYYPELLQELFLYQRYFIYYMSSFTAGYFIYDFMDMILNNKCIKMWEVTLHHIAVTSAFVYVVVNRFAMGYHVLSALAEVNSFFLHSRKLLQWHQIGFNHWFYRLACWCNITSFFVFRGLSLGSLTYGMFVYRHRVSTFLYSMIFVSLFIMDTINPVLFWRLLKSDFIRRDHYQAKERLNINGNNNIKEIKQQ